MNKCRLWSWPQGLLDERRFNIWIENFLFPITARIIVHEQEFFSLFCSTFCIWHFSSSRFRMRVDFFGFLLRQKSSLSNFGIRKKDFVYWHQKKQLFIDLLWLCRQEKIKITRAYRFSNFQVTGLKNVFMWPKRVRWANKINKRNKTLKYHHTLL